MIRYIAEKSVEEVNLSVHDDLKTANVTDKSLDHCGTAEEEEPPSQSVPGCC